MFDYDKPAPGDETAELRIRAVVAVFNNGALWPVDGKRPAIVRETMAPEVRATVDGAIDEAFALCTEIKNLGPAGPTYVLKKDVREWLKAISTVPAGDGLSNIDRLRQAFRAADGGGFRPGEFGLLWQQLRIRPEYR